MVKHLYTAFRIIFSVILFLCDFVLKPDFEDSRVYILTIIMEMAIFAYFTKR